MQTVQPVTVLSITSTEFHEPEERPLWKDLHEDGISDLEFLTEMHGGVSLQLAFHPPKNKQHHARQQWRR